ncbi:hypothetical protein [Pantoea dispersa]|uniref:hypothetical protein n=1 Tax=Pantoea dispersa TaxID=59814 RepID=UPI0024AE9175|nr:hypothetical protein [Pantoea dispersa]MDI6636471.1 hypothetical protein [Pantoea dispersa]
MVTNLNVEFHKSCSHYFVEGIKYISLREKKLYSNIKRKSFIIDLNFASLRDIILDVSRGMFAEQGFSVFVIFIANDALLPLANFFILKSEYRTILVRIKDIDSGSILKISRKAIFPGDILTEKEFLTLALCFEGKEPVTIGINPKTFCSRKYAALRKLGKPHFSLFYT